MFDWHKAIKVWLSDIFQNYFQEKVHLTDWDLLQTLSGGFLEEVFPQWNLKSEFV